MTISLKTLRDEAIVYIYENGAGKPAWSVDAKDFSNAMKEIGATESQASSVLSMMFSQGLLETKSCPVGRIGLNYLGQSEAERLGPRERYSASQIPQSIVIGSVSQGATVQIAGARSVQNSTTNNYTNNSMEIFMQKIIEEVESIPHQSAEKIEAIEILKEIKIENQGRRRQSILKSLQSGALNALNSMNNAAASEIAKKLVGEIFL